MAPNALWPAPVSLKVRDASLSEALFRLHEERDISFACVSASTRRLSDHFEAGSLYELADMLAEAYGSRIMAEGPVLMAFDEPSSESALWRTYLETLIAQLEKTAPREGNLRSVLWQVLTDNGGREAPAPDPDRDISVPYHLTDKEDVALLQGAYMADMLAELRASVDRQPPSPDRLVWRQGSLVAVLAGQTGSITIVPRGYRAATHELPEQRAAERVAAPRAVSSLWPSAVLDLPVTLRESGSLRAVLDQAAQQSQTEIQSLADAAQTRVHAAFADCPLWAVLDCTSVLTGRRWWPKVDSERYSFDDVGATFASHAFAAAPLSFRHSLLYGKRNGGALFMELIYASLPDALKPNSAQESQTAFASLPVLCQQCLERQMWSQQVLRIADQLSKAQWVLNQPELRGRFRIGRLGDIDASVPTGSHSSRGVNLRRAPGMTLQEFSQHVERREDAAFAHAVAYARAAGVKRGDPLRYSVAASDSNYGSRGHTGSRLKLRTAAGEFEGQLVAAPRG